MAIVGVFKKTAKGAAELGARSIKLAPTSRMALIMTDGVKTAADLASKLGGEAGVEAAFTELLGHGLIEKVADAASSSTGATPAVQAPASSAPAMGFEALRKWAAKYVSGAMGPTGDDYCMLIERAKTPADLDAAAERARNAIGSFTSRGKGDAFWTQYQANRGA